MRIVNLIGKRFGKLVVVAKANKTDKNKNQYWVCKCDCGNLKEIRGTHLGESVNSCSCLAHLPKGESCFNQIYGYYKRNAKVKDRVFKLSKKEFRELTQQNCVYCGMAPSTVMKRKRHNGTFTYNGVDRIDSSKGYVKDNCVPCCKICNRMKLVLSYKDFIDKIKQIYEHLIVVD